MFKALGMGWRGAAGLQSHSVHAAVFAALTSGDNAEQTRRMQAT